MDTADVALLIQLIRFPWNHSSVIFGILLSFVYRIYIGLRAPMNHDYLKLRQVTWATRSLQQFQTREGGDSVLEKGAYHKYQRGVDVFILLT